MRGIFQEIEGQPSQAAEVLGAVILSQAAGVFAEAHVQQPDFGALSRALQLVLHAPVGADGVGQSSDLQSTARMAMVRMSVNT